MTVRSVLDVTTHETQTGNFHFLSLKELRRGRNRRRPIKNLVWRNLRFSRHLPAAAPVCLEVDPRSVCTDLDKVGSLLPPTPVRVTGPVRVLE